jgi:hypothetical protein
MSKTKWLALTPTDVHIGVVQGAVMMQCHFDGNAIGLAHDTGLAIRMLPAEAREIAQSLLQQADGAEALQRSN